MRIILCDISVKSHNLEYITAHAWGTWKAWVTFSVEKIMNSYYSFIAVYDSLPFWPGKPFMP